MRIPGFLGFQGLGLQGGQGASGEGARGWKCTVYVLVKLLFCLTSLTFLLLLQYKITFLFNARAIRVGAKLSGKIRQRFGVVRACKSRESINTSSVKGKTQTGQLFGQRMDFTVVPLLFFLEIYTYLLMNLFLIQLSIIQPS